MYGGLRYLNLTYISNDASQNNHFTKSCFQNASSGFLFNSMIKEDIWNPKFSTAFFYSIMILF